MPGEGNKTLRIDEKSIFALQQVGLLNTVIGIDPIKAKRDRIEKEPKKHIYHRWNIEAMDESLFVSDGTTEDGGKVRLKISDKFQYEIEKVRDVEKVDNHLVYTNNPDANMDTWNENALIHKAYLKKHYPEPFRLRKEWDNFKAKIDSTVEELRSNLKQALDDEDKKIELIGEAFGKLNAEWETFKSDIKKIIEGDWQEWEKFKEGIKNHLKKLERSLKEDLDNYEKDLSKRIDESYSNFEKSTQIWLLKELKKPQYKGKDGSTDFTVKDMIFGPLYGTDKFLAPNRKVTNYAGKEITLAPPTIGYRDAQILIAPLLSSGGNGPATTIQGLVMSASSTRYTDLKLVDWDPDNGKVRTQRVWISTSWFKENEDLGDIINQHRNLVEEVKALKAQVSELTNLIKAKEKK